MTDTGREGLETRDEDRLPWLEAVEDEDGGDGPSALKLLLGVVIALLAIGVVVGGVFWLKNRAEAPQGDASLIAAPSSPYKVKPAEPGGMKVEGTGDSAYGASEGQVTNGAIDLSAMPETALNADRSPPPIATKPVPAPETQPKQAAPVESKPAPTPKPAPVKVAAASAKAPIPKQAMTHQPLRVPVPPELRAGAPAATPAPQPVVAGGGTVQLGAFSSEAKANAAWKSLSARFGFLKPLMPAVTPVASGGNTLYRLRAGAGGQAGTVCAKLKVAGETCAVVG